MTADQMAVSVVDTLSKPKGIAPGYYRSRLFNTPFSANPLIAGAGPLLSLLERLNISQTLPPLDTILDNIRHELHAFHSSLVNKPLSEEVDAIAHYLLSATIDEVLGKSYLRVNGVIAQFNAFAPSAADNVGPEKRFFDIVNFIKETPHQYLDTIELAYYCLITGFEGHYHGKPEGRVHLDNLIEDLFQLIQQYRVNKNHLLFKDTEKQMTLKRNEPVLLISVLLAGLVLLSVTFSYFLLEAKAKNMQFGHTVIEKLDN